MKGRGKYKHLFSDWLTLNEGIIIEAKDAFLFKIRTNLRHQSSDQIWHLKIYDLWKEQNDADWGHLPTWARLVTAV